MEAWTDLSGERQRAERAGPRLLLARQEHVSYCGLVRVRHRPRGAVKVGGGPGSLTAQPRGTMAGAGGSEAITGPCHLQPSILVTGHGVSHPPTLEK